MVPRISVSACYALALTFGVFRESYGGDGTAAWTACTAGVGVCIGGLEM